MKKYYLLLAILIMSGCTDSAKPIVLQKELSPYDGVQKQCFSLQKDESPQMQFVHKECTDFQHSLEVVNSALVLKKGYRNDPRYFKAKNDYNVAKKRINSQHKHLNLVLKSKAFIAIDTNDKETFKKIVSFPLQPMNIHYYNYMKRYPKTFAQNKKFCRFKVAYAQKKYDKGYALVNRGKFTQGLTRLSLSAEMGNVKAARLCGDVYYDLYPQKSLDCYKQAVKVGDKESQYNLARLYEDENKGKEAYKWYKKSALNGNYISQFKMYEFYKDGKDVLQDSRKSLTWLEKSALNGYPKGQYSFGMVLLSQHKEVAAIKNLQAAANQGETSAYYPLGKLYFSQKNYKQAYKMLSQADANADGMYKLAYLKEHGKGTSRSYYSAYTFYKKSEQLGKKSAKKDMYRMAKAKKRLKTKSRKKEQHLAVLNDKQIKQNRQRRHLAETEDKRLRKQWADKKSEAKMLKVRACGSEPSDSILRSCGTRVHLEGQVTQWLGKSAFIVKAHGQEYYVKDSNDEARVNKGDNVNIIADTTGKREIIKGLRRSIFEEPDESAIAKAYALNFTGVCPY